MHYLGGKFRTAKPICAFLNSIALAEWGGEPPCYIEPFVGGANIVPKLAFKHRVASDVNEAMITLYRSLQCGWVPPTTVTEDEYAYYKKMQDATDPMTAFVGIGCSFSGKWFGGYARDPKSDRNYALNAQRSLIKLAPKLDGILFNSVPYSWYDPVNSLVYCDPPYAGTTGYAGTPTFDHGVFYDVVRKWAVKGNVIVVSEYNAPKDFECVLAMNTHTDMQTKNGGKESRTEKLFMHESQSHLFLL